MSLTKRRRPSIRNPFRKRAARRHRPLFCQALEKRILLAADMKPLWQNPHDPLDVSGNCLINQSDADLVRDKLQALGGASPLPPTGPVDYFWDVNGDDVISEADLDLIVQHLVAKSTGGQLTSADGGGTLSSISLTLDQPIDADETEGFIIRGYISPPGQYTLDGTLTAEYTPGFPVETDANGMFEVSSMFGDDGTSPGNGTPSDLENLYMEVWLADDPSESASDSTTVTIHNVAPELDIDFVNYPLGGPVWEVQGQVNEICVAICSPDLQTVTIDWGDGASPTVLAGIAAGVAFDPIPYHEYARTGGSYTITVTVEDDDGGDDSDNKTFNMYRFDLDNDADNNGQIEEADEPIEDIEPGAYFRLNTDDDNENSSSDLSDSGPISDEDDLEEFKLEFVPAIRADVNNYSGWELWLTFDVTNTGSGSVWSTKDKAGLISFTEEMPELQTYGRKWTVGNTADPIPSSLFLEASAAGTIRLQWSLVSPNFGIVDSDRVVFTAIENRRTILMTGYWPVTDIGVPERHGMLWDWKDLKENYESSGYNVIAISAKFPKDPLSFTGDIPNWGKGTGDLQVDYRDTSADFWKIVEKWDPIAIMSFSRGSNDKSWELEAGARNLEQADWATNPLGLLPPHAGGSAADLSPYRGTGTVAGNPPDPTKTAADKDGAVNETNSRASSLPLAEIEAAVDAAFTDEQIDPWTDNSFDVGAYVSEYMAYHVSWYRAYINAMEKPSLECKFAGHTHVGVKVSAANAASAVEIQLDELIKKLNPT